MWMPGFAVRLCANIIEKTLGDFCEAIDDTLYGKLLEWSEESCASNAKSYIPAAVNNDLELSKLWQIWDSSPKVAHNFFVFPVFWKAKISVVMNRSSLMSAQPISFNVCKTQNLPRSTSCNAEFSAHSWRFCYLTKSQMIFLGSAKPSCICTVGSNWIGLKTFLEGPELKVAPRSAEKLWYTLTIHEAGQSLNSGSTAQNGR